MAWIGRKKIAFVPVYRPNARPPDVIPADWNSDILRRVLCDPDKTSGADRTLRAYIHAASSGRADLDAVVMPMITVDQQDVPPNLKGKAIINQKKGTKMNPLTQFKKIRILPLLIALALVAVASPPVARADAVTDWNAIASTAIVMNAGQPVLASVLSFAMVQGAVYDAVNTIDRGHQPYLVQPSANPTDSKEAAAAMLEARMNDGRFGPEPFTVAERSGRIAGAEYLASAPGE